MMEVLRGDQLETPIRKEDEACIGAEDKRGADAIGYLESIAFYDEAGTAYAVIATGESALYANIMLQKGVV